MSEESDAETTELEIGSKSFNRLKEKMKTLGFQDGRAKGRDLSLQEGFNMGYSAGFNVGKSLGIARGITRCQAELNGSLEDEIFDRRKVDSLSIESCFMCQNHRKNEEVSDKLFLETIENVALMQQKYIDGFISSSQSESKQKQE